MTKTKKKTIRIIILSVILFLVLFKTIDCMTLKINKISYYVSGGLSMYYSEIVVDSNGNVKEYRDYEEDSYNEWTIDEKNWNAMVRAIRFYGFVHLPDEIDGLDIFYDASDYMIEIETNRGVYRKGGYLAGFGLFGGNFQFARIKNVLTDNIYQD